MAGTPKIVACVGVPYRVVFRLASFRQQNIASLTGAHKTLKISFASKASDTHKSAITPPLCACSLL